MYRADPGKQREPRPVAPQQGKSRPASCRMAHIAFRLAAVTALASVTVIFALAVSR